MTIKEIDDLTWAWTTKAMEDLTEISKKAGAASKAAATLHDKLYLRNVQTTALDGLKTVALVFGEISVQNNELNVARAHFDLLLAISNSAGHSPETTPGSLPLLLAGLLALDEVGLAKLTPLGARRWRSSSRSAPGQLRIRGHDDCRRRAVLPIRRYVYDRERKASPARSMVARAPVDRQRGRPRDVPPPR